MGTEVTGEVNTVFLQDFADAWNDHDVDALMSFMGDECSFEFSSGPDLWGTRFEGREQVRAAFIKVLETFPDGQWVDASHFVAGDRGVSQWTFKATMPDGTRTEVHGCDIFTFRDGKISDKNSYRKNRTTS